MSNFWFFARKMFAHRATVSWAITFAIISAAGLGVGLMSLAPILQLILGGQGSSLQELAMRFNDGGHWIGVPAGIVHALPQGRLAGVGLILGFIVVLAVLGGTANFLHQYLSQTLASKVVAQIRQETFRHVIHQPLSEIMDRGPSEYIARILGDCRALQAGFILLTSKTVAQLGKGLAAFIAAITFHWPITLVAIVVAPVLAIVLRKLGKRIRRGTRAALKAGEGLLRVTTQTLHGMRAVKVNTGERQAALWFHRFNKEALKQELRLRTVRALSSPLMEVLATIAVCVLAFVAAGAIISGTLSFERFALALASLGVAAASLRPLSGMVNELHAAAAPADRLMEILDRPREASSAVRLKRPPRHHISIRFEDVSYAYPGANRRALDRVSLTIPAGTRLALVGPNGSGKTTLASLLPRLLEPQSGRVLIDDIDIATVNLRSLRRQIGVVTQETVLFRGTVAQNIGFGSGELVDRDLIVDAARRAHADEFIRQLPEGYDTNLAELGSSLSGGQRQRVAIARAILRDPAILILDEATSQIDAESEAHINAALSEFSEGRTAILIAHRLSTVLNADRIAVLDDGRLVADGTHQELLATSDLYQRLTKKQLVRSV